MNGPKWVDDVEYTPCEMCGQYAANPDTGLCNGCEQQYNDWMEPKLAPNRLARKGEGNGNDTGPRRWEIRVDGVDRRRYWEARGFTMSTVATTPFRSHIYYREVPEDEAR